MSLTVDSMASVGLSEAHGLLLSSQYSRSSDSPQGRVGLFSGFEGQHRRRFYRFSLICNVNNTKKLIFGNFVEFLVFAYKEVLKFRFISWGVDGPPTVEVAPPVFSDLYKSAQFLLIATSTQNR